jgi:hypothetical protein
MNGGVVDVSVQIDVSVQMNQAVSKLRHLLQAGAMSAVDDALLLQHLERVGIVLRRPEPLGGDQVIGDIQTAFDADLKVILCTADKNLITVEQFKRHAPEIFQRIQKLVKQKDLVGDFLNGNQL